MSSFHTNLLAHREKDPSATHPRHPLVVFCHLPYAAALIFAYLTLADRTFGQTFYFVITVGLYACSAAYHTFRPNRTLRFMDQTLISWYVIVTPLPLIYHEPWALPLCFSLMGTTLLSKWYEWEPDYRAGSQVFFSLGALSALLVFQFGLPAAGLQPLGAAGLWIVIAIVCFICKLVIYHFRKARLIPDIWESPESGHFVLAIGVTIYTGIILIYPV